MGAIPLRRHDALTTGPAESIESLVEQAQAGDVRAFEVVYRRTSDRVYAICLRMSVEPMSRRSMKMAKGSSRAM